MTKRKPTRPCIGCGVMVNAKRLRCPDCVRAHKAERARLERQAPEGKARAARHHAAHRAKPGVREREREYMRQRRTDPAVQARESEYGKKYSRRPEVRERKNAARRNSVSYKERWNNISRERYANDPEYRRRKQGMVGFSSDKNRRVLAERDGTMCRWCGRELDPMDRQGVHVDHIVPRSKGGTSTLDNMQLLHAKCNMAKRSGPMEPPE